MNLKRIARQQVSLLGHGDKSPRWYDVELRIDADELLRNLRSKAALNKSGRTVLGGGTIVITAKPQGGK